MRNVKAENANFTNVGLLESDLTGSDFSNVNFSKADIRRCVIKNTNLRGSIFFKANLAMSDMSGSYIDENALTEANTYGTLIPRVRHF